MKNRRGMISDKIGREMDIGTTLCYPPVVYGKYCSLFVDKGGGLAWGISLKDTSNLKFRRRNLRLRSADERSLRRWH